MKYKRIYISVLVSILIVSTGCWDRIEIENRAFVLGIGLDKNNESDKIALTYQIALPSAMYGEGGADGKKVLNITSTSPTVTRAEKQILTRLDRVPNKAHTQVLIIGEDLARKGITKYMDYFLRDSEMRRRTKVLIADGKAQDLFKIVPPTANSTSDYIGNIMLFNEKDVHRISSEVDLLKMTENLRRGMDFIVAKATKGKDDIAVTGAAIFKKDKLVGYLGPEEVRKTKWLIDDISRGTIVLKDVNGMKGYIIFEISTGTTKVKPIIKGDDVDFDISIRVEGDVVESEDLEFLNTMEQNFISEFEKAIENEIIKECNDIVRKARDEFDAEFFNFGRLVKNYNLKWFEEHEAEWREIFKRSKLNIKADVNIRRVGLIQ